MSRGAHVCYYTNGKGYWLRREWKPQCSARVFLSGRCQGVKGHKGVHWCYSPSGDFDWDDNDDDPHEDGCSGSTPPGHKDYASHVKMQKHCHSNHYTDAQVTDKAVIAMLEKGRTPERDAAIDRPVTNKATLDYVKELESRKSAKAATKPTHSGKRPQEGPE